MSDWKDHVDDIGTEFGCVRSKATADPTSGGNVAIVPAEYLESSPFAPTLTEARFENGFSSSRNDGEADYATASCWPR